MLPASTPAMTATKPSSAFHPIVKYSSLRPRSTISLRSETALCLIFAVYTHESNTVQKFRFNTESVWGRRFTRPLHLLKSLRAATVQTTVADSAGDLCQWFARSLWRDNLLLILPLISGDLRLFQALVNAEDNFKSSGPVENKRHTSAHQPSPPSQQQRFQSPLLRQFERPLPARRYSRVFCPTNHERESARTWLLHTERTSFPAASLAEDAGRFEIERIARIAPRKNKIEDGMAVCRVWLEPLSWKNRCKFVDLSDGIACSRNSRVGTFTFSKRGFS